MNMNQNPQAQAFWDFISGMANDNNRGQASAADFDPFTASGSPFGQMPFRGGRHGAHPPPPPHGEHAPPPPHGERTASAPPEHEGDEDFSDPPTPPPPGQDLDEEMSDSAPRHRGRHAHHGPGPHGLHHGKGPERRGHHGGPEGRGRGGKDRDGFGGPGHRHHGPHGPSGEGKFGKGPHANAHGGHGPPGEGKFGKGPHGHGPHGGRGGRGPHGQGHRGHGPHHGHGRPSFPFDLNEMASFFAPQLFGGNNNMNRDLTIDHAAGTFVPDVDVFEMQSRYILHTSLPGAKKSDIDVSWNERNSSVVISGVVHRPEEVDEDMMNTMSTDERKVGAFERSIRLGSPDSKVDAEGIGAKLEDGVLRVVVPKVREDEWTEVKKVDIE